jgi:hypothetical protein
LFAAGAGARLRPHGSWQGPGSRWRRSKAVSCCPPPACSILIDPGFGGNEQVDVFGNYPVKVVN